MSFKRKQDNNSIIIRTKPNDEKERMRIEENNSEVYILYDEIEEEEYPGITISRAIKDKLLYVFLILWNLIFILDLNLLIVVIIELGKF